MSTPKLGNCPNCGKLYIRIRHLCDHCHQEEEKTFLTVARYIRENPGCSIQEVSEATGVAIKQINSYMRSGRIVTNGLANLEYPCEICGEIIHSGRVCSDCLQTANELKNQLQKGIKNDETHSPQINKGYIKYL